MGLVSTQKIWLTRRRPLSSILLVILAILSVVGLAYSGSLVSSSFTVEAQSSESVVIPPAPISDSEPPRYLFSIYGNNSEPLLKPLSVAEGPNGDIHVVDSGHGVVRIFDSLGKLKGTLGKKTLGAPSPGELRYPLGVAVGDDGRVFVSDSMSGRISTFSNGAFVGYFGEAEGEKFFSVPAGLFFFQGELYVNDTGAHQVLVYSAAGELRATIGAGRGAKPGEMEFPNFSWVDGDGRLVVADSNNNRVQIFEGDGDGKFGAIPAAVANLALPRGVGIDPFGRVHVVSALAHRVEVFDTSGMPLFTYGERGLDDAQFNFPNGVFVGAMRVYIADRENNRVQVWGF